VLFPYSAKHLAAYVAKHAGDPIVKSCLEGTGGASVATAVETLLLWIKEDRKHPALKTLQGLIWREGYESGAFTSLLYPDVKPALAAWHERGVQLGVYSSGSVEAQKLLFKYTVDGDLTPLFSHYFDTAVGAKREPEAYRKILTALEMPGAEVLFLSDIPEELDAAKAAGVSGIQLVRPGTAPTNRHRSVRDFSEIGVVPK
jgi:enolase-phosphatase E1